jgi:hypothetical protein
MMAGAQKGRRIARPCATEDEKGEAFSEATFPIHDRIMGIQSSTLTMLMNPTTLRRFWRTIVRRAME